ncbi:hypothetical protein [Azohydromonas aeria]|uniref:hypothetical protein n=1 Tax=Azohydromonas aeria TaxID=2590212 RepID=UPI0012FCBCC0|nr:hypothetical protein [Azohydromonas aeria]
MNPPTANPALHRRRRAAIAEQLLAASPALAGDIEWDALDAAPPWLALDAAASDRLQCRAGALLCGAELRLWIDRPRVAAARAAVGETWWKALLAQPVPALPPGVAPQRVGDGAPVVERLQALGAAVLLSALEPLPLRRAAAPLLAVPAPLDFTAEAARQLIAAAESLEALA